MRVALIGSLLFLSGAPYCFASNITLAWDPSPDPSVTGYKIYYGGESGVYTNSIDAGNVTSNIVTSLLPGVTYYFSASAYDATALESDLAPEVSGTTPGLNVAPTLDPIVSLAINESSGPQTISLSGISSGSTNENQTLVVSAISSNPGLIPNPTVTYTSPNATGTLGFTPVPLAFGSAVITVTVNDGSASNNIVTRTFTVTVNSVNQPPDIERACRSDDKRECPRANRKSGGFPRVRRMRHKLLP